MDKDTVLQKRIYEALERWTVFRLIEAHMDITRLDDFKKSVFESLKLNSKKAARNENDMLNAISADIFDLLDGLNVEADNSSCDRMASIICELHREVLSGQSDFYNRLVATKIVEYEYESSD